MPCYHPLTGYYSNKENASGKRSLVFSIDNSLVPIPQQIPCGRCIGCRLERSRQWAVRCVHEASLHSENCFITLTFSDSFLPKNGSLDVADFQKFMKRLRQFISPRKVRFFHCGEYGENFGRPHHHACLFGYDFPDKVLFKEVNGSKIFTSAILSDLWPFGFSTIGDVTYESAAYVARYVLKKWSKDDLEGKDLYEEMKRFSESQKKTFSSSKIPGSTESWSKAFYDLKKPEYITMSRGKGIGSGWYDKFSSDVYPHGYLIVDGVKVKPPVFYDRKYELDNLFSYVNLKGERYLKSLSRPYSQRRLNIKEEYKKTITKCLTRGFENGSQSV